MFNIDEKISKEKAKNMSPVTLAFIGDAVYSLYVREFLSYTSDAKSGVLSKRATEIVNATAQASLMKTLIPHLTEEEENVYRRARNAKKSAKAKSATVAEYNMSTGFEALLGFLYVTGDIERINYLLNLER